MRRQLGVWEEENEKSTLYKSGRVDDEGVVYKRDSCCERQKVSRCGLVDEAECMSMTCSCSGHADLASVIPSSCRAAAWTAQENAIVNCSLSGSSSSSTRMRFRHRFPDPQAVKLGEQAWACS